MYIQISICSIDGNAIFLSPKVELSVPEHQNYNVTARAEDMQQIRAEALKFALHSSEFEKPNNRVRLFNLSVSNALKQVLQADLKSFLFKFRHPV